MDDRHNDFQSEYEARAARFRERAERRAERWAAYRESRAEYYASRRERRCERRAQRRAERNASFGDYVALWRTPDRGPSALTLRLRDMVKQVDEITQRVDMLEKLTMDDLARMPRPFTVGR